jgi:hypothetical protein
VADSEVLRSRRARSHRAGDHSLCRNCAAGRVAAQPTGLCVASHRAELEQMGLANSSDGSIVLALAGILDAQKGAVGAAATADRLNRLMETLRKRQPAKRTPLDEFSERRARRRA